MAELLSPGIFIEEVPSNTQVVGAVSTSNMGIVGWTPQGPVDAATLITSFDQFVKTFGSFDRRSFLAYSVAAFFTNGGRRAFVVRTTPSDAAAASAQIQSTTTDQSLGTGDGTIVAYTATSTTSVLKDNNGASPIKASSVSIRWRGKGVQVTNGAVKKRDGVTSLVTAALTLAYEGRLDPTAIPAVDESLMSVVPEGTTVIKWLSATVAKTITIPAPTGSSTVAVGTNVAGSTCTFDFRTGVFSLLIIVGETPDAAGAVTATFYPATVTHTVVDDGAGALTGANLAAPGTIAYTTGAYSFTTAATTSIPHVKSPILATYSIAAWSLAPVSPGAWGNNLSVQIIGSPNYFTTATSTYTRFTLLVFMIDSNGNNALQETYEDLVWDDSSSPFFFADIVNEFSNLIAVAEPGGNEAPGQLQGKLRTIVIAGGSDLDTVRVVQVTVPNGPIAKRTVSIAYTDSASVARVITDDGKGNLVGDIDPSYVTTGANTVNYATGALDFKTLPVAGPLGIKANTLVTATYYSISGETTHTEALGDTTKGYTVGTDGTFETNFGRSQFTSPALAPDYRGVYALDRIDELMQVVIPDFAGDTIVTGDLLDYANSRANLSSGGDRFIVLTVPKGSSATDAVDWFRNKLARFSNFAALYWPWVKVTDPLTNRSLTMPVVGHVAGVYARTDSNRNVGKSPGGTVDGQLGFLTGLELVPTQGERDFVYPNKINPLIQTPQTGIAVWGVRTIALDSQWRYINARRLFMFVEKSVYNSTFWIVFENNGPALWARIKAQIIGFLLSLYNDGYFAGSTPDQAFFVTVDETNNSTATINAGQVIIDVGIAPNKPAEFVRFRFQQLISGS